MNPNFNIVAAKKKKLLLDVLTKKPLTLKTGMLSTPFLPSAFENEWKSFANYKLSTRVTPEFADVCDFIDNKVKAEFDESTVYSGLLRRKGDYPPLLSLTFPRDSVGRFETVVFKDDKTTKILLTEDNIKDVFCKGRDFLAEIECEKLWDFTAKDNVHRAGMIWNIKQVVIQPMDSEEGSEPDTSVPPIVVNLLV